MRYQSIVDAGYKVYLHMGALLVKVVACVLIRGLGCLYQNIVMCRVLHHLAAGYDDISCDRSAVCGNLHSIRTS
jgi:hypothetical protein